MKKGDSVKITGDISDFTDHLEGMIGTVIVVRKLDLVIRVKGDSWLCWNKNLKKVEGAR